MSIRSEIRPEKRIFPRSRNYGRIRMGDWQIKFFWLIRVLLLRLKSLDLAISIQKNNIKNHFFVIIYVVVRFSKGNSQLYREAAIGVITNSQCLQLII